MKTSKVTKHVKKLVGSDDAASLKLMELQIDRQQSASYLVDLYPVSVLSAL